MRTPKKRVFVTDAGGGVNPATLPTIEALFYSDTGVIGADGALIAAWTNTRWSDESGKNRHATLALHGSPTLRKTGANLTPGGKAVVEFLGTTQGLDFSFGGVPISGANGWTFIFYYKSINLSAGHNNDLLYANVGLGIEIPAYSNIGFNGYDRDGKPGLDCGNVVRKTFDPTNTVGWHMYSLVLGGAAAAAGTATGYLDGVTLTPTFANWNVALESSCTLGNSPGSNSDLQGVLAAAAVFSDDLSLSQRAGVETYLHTRFD